MAVFQLLLAEAEVGAAQAGVQRVGLELEQHLRLGRVLGEEAAADHLGAAHLQEELARQRQAAAIDAAQAVFVGAAADEGAQVLVEEALGDALGLEELAEIRHCHVALAVRAERVTLLQRVVVGGVQLALIALIEEVVGIIEHQGPAVLGQQRQPVAHRLRQSRGGAAHLVDRVTLAGHARLGHLERSLVAGTGIGQAGQLALQFVQRLQAGGQFDTGAAVVVEQLVQHFEAALQSLARGVRGILGQGLLRLFGGGTGQLGGLAQLALGALQRFGGGTSVVGGLGQALEAGVVAHFHQQLQQRRIGRGQAAEQGGASAGTADRLQAELGDGLAPVVAVITEVQLLQLYHQAAEVAGAEALALAQYPVVTQDLAHQVAALGGEGLAVAGLGVEAGNGVVAAIDQPGLRPELLAQTVVRQAARLFTQHAIDHIGQRLAAQHLARLGDQLGVERIGREGLVEQTGEMGVEAMLRRAVAGIAQRPVGGYPLLEEGGVAALFQVEHQVGAQAAEQALAVAEVGADLRLQLTRHTWQQQGFQLGAVGRINGRIDRLALEQAGTLQVGHLALGREHQGRGVAAV